MRDFPGPIRRSVLFAFICALLPLACLLLYLEVPHVSAPGLPFIALGAAGPAFPLLSRLGWYTSLEEPANILKAIVPALAWFAVALPVHLVVRRTWVAAVIVIGMFLFFSVLNFSLLIKYF